MSNRAHFFFLFPFPPPPPLPSRPPLPFFCVQRDVSKDAKRLRHPGGNPPLFDISPHHRRPKHSSRANVCRPSPRDLPPPSTLPTSVIRSTRTKSVGVFSWDARALRIIFFLVGEKFYRFQLRIRRRLPPSASKCALPSPPRSSRTLRTARRCKMYACNLSGHQDWQT